MTDNRTYLVEPDEDEREVASFHFLSNILEDDFEKLKEVVQN